MKQEQHTEASGKEPEHFHRPRRMATTITTFLITIGEVCLVNGTPHILAYARAQPRRSNIVMTTTAREKR